MIFDTEHPPQGSVRDWLDARAASQDVAIVFPETDEVLTWSELQQTACRMARGLYALGAEKGESIAVIHPNGKAGVCAVYAALYGGFRTTMINLAAGPAAIAYALDHSGARFAFVHDSQTDTFATAAPEGLARLDPDALDADHPTPRFEALCGPQWKQLVAGSLSGMSGSRWSQWAGESQ